MLRLFILTLEKGCKDAIEPRAFIVSIGVPFIQLGNTSYEYSHLRVRVNA